MREMKNSGVPWIGEIPKGWMVRRIKTLFSERTELSETGNETLMSVSEYYGVDSRASHIEEDEHLFRSESLVGYKKCYPGDIVSNIMLAWKGSLGVARQAGIVSPAYCVYMRVANVFPMYYHYLFRTSLYTWQFKCYSKGIIDSRLRLYSPFFYDIPALIPPVTEQRRIADFLDAKCAEIDSVMEQTRASIEEYKALKQSVITEAVTKGIRGNRPMKDSGVEWIGEIPEDWNIVALKTLCRMKAGKNLTSEQIKDEGAYPVYGGNGERGFYNEYLFDGLFLLVGRQGALCGNVHKVEGRFWPTEHALVTTPSNTTDIQYLFYLLISANLNQYASDSAAQPGLSVGAIRNIRVVLPQIQEQQEIAAYLNEKCSTIDSLIASKEALITELEAYKKSLIYEYVTGKKEVL